jgi:aromatic ring-cleaving dioxygenase
MPKSNAGVTSVKDADRIAHYHAHVYYDPATMTPTTPCMRRGSVRACR